MAWLSSLLTAILTSVANALNSYLAAQQARADDISLGQQQAATADAQAAAKAAQAMTAASVSAPKDVAGVELELDSGTF